MKSIDELPLSLSDMRALYRILAGIADSVRHDVSQPLGAIFYNAQTMDLVLSRDESRRLDGDAGLRDIATDILADIRRARRILGG